MIGMTDYSLFKRESDANHCPCACSHHCARRQSECERKHFHSCPECDIFLCPELNCITSDAKHGPCARSRHSLRLKSECEEERFHSRPECDNSVSGAKFQYNVRALVARALSLLHELPLAIQRRSEHADSHVSDQRVLWLRLSMSYLSAVWEWGRSWRGFYLFISAHYAISAALSQWHAALGHWRNAEFYAHGTHWVHHVAESGNDRRVLNRMGNHPGKQNIELCVAKHSLLRPLKLFGAPHSLEVWKMFCPTCKDFTCWCVVTTPQPYEPPGGMRSFKLHAQLTGC